MRPSAERARRPHPLVMAEIGVRLGKNASEILHSMNITRMYLVDGYEPYQDSEKSHCNLEEQNNYYWDMFQNLAPLFHLVTLVTRPSKFASTLFPNKFFDYVYIDANHTEASVLEDMRLWYPKVKSGGVLGGHDMGDVNFPGVEKAVIRFSEEKGVRFKHIDEDWIIDVE